ncbi:MAG TPA: pyridoxal-phosphate dependent enzyme [Vicinamibacterales bacterium]|jgi:threonine dehydratase|nr:pyridoxal-phosphate dependent enzyme [Vicinamibacterales bacterium]
MNRRISIDTIRDAARSVYEAAVRTPLVPLGQLVPGGPEVFLKLETLQPIGSFKIRGAYNAVRRLPAEQTAGGVWTVSAGNAAQGVALAARKAGVPCSVMVMDTAPDAKINAINRLGAEIVRATYDECWRTVESHGSPRMKGHFVHPFDDDDFISGNGTAGLEIVEDLPDVDAVVASVGGGGLLSGIGVAMRALRPGAKIYASEPETAAPLKRSMEKGRASRFEEWQPSFVDGAGGKSVLETMWPLLREYVDDSIVVPLDDTARAMKLVAERVRVIAEGAGACAVAAAISPEMARRGHTKIVAVVSGGNVDLARFAQLVGACPSSNAS